MRAKTVKQKPLRPRRAPSGPKGPTSKRVDSNRYPKGWDRKRVESLAEHYEKQSDEEAIAEMEAAFADGAFAMIQVPTKLVPKVRAILAKGDGPVAAKATPLVQRAG